MGDVGSLSLGAAIGTLAILLKKEILLIIVGGVFVIEALSVIIQVIYFKYSLKYKGKGIRIFKMAPLHHHFELNGWPETKNQKSDCFKQYILEELNYTCNIIIRIHII